MPNFSLIGTYCCHFGVKTRFWANFQVLELLYPTSSLIRAKFSMRELTYDVLYHAKFYHGRCMSSPIWGKNTPLPNFLRWRFLCPPLLMLICQVLCELVYSVVIERWKPLIWLYFQHHSSVTPPSSYETKLNMGAQLHLPSPEVSKPFLFSNTLMAKSFAQT